MSELLYMNRFIAKTKMSNNGCVDWSGNMGAFGYGLVNYKGKRFRAHRLAYCFANGIDVFTLSPKQFVCHSCDNRKCVNPEHLWLGTCKDNLVDASDKQRLHYQKRTHCNHGHPFSGENLFMRIDGGRGCLECRRKNMRESYHRKQERLKKQIYVHKEGE